ncbi:hypothetical protein BD414DRAFT_1224 [Trametes punicea]|nr:hypothetical protein BD414DRAFT_1224 [Trametes punicea]
MFTTLITFFFTVLGALRATPLYTGILTIGNGLQFRSWFNGAVSAPLLDNKTAGTTGTSTGTGTGGTLIYGLPFVLSLPPAPLTLSLSPPPPILTLPPGHSHRALLVIHSPLASMPANLGTRQLHALLGLLLLVGFITSLAVRIVFHLRAAFVSTTDSVASTAKCITAVPPGAVLIIGKPYDDNCFEAAYELVNIPEIAGASPSPSASSTPAATEQTIARAPRRKRRRKAAAAQMQPPELEVIPALAPALAATVRPQPSSSPKALAESSDDALFDTPADADGDGMWATWTNHRCRRLRRPRPPAPSALYASSSRSSSIVSSSRTVDSLFSRVESTPTAPTSLASSRRSSITTSSPHKLPPLDLPSVQSPSTARTSTRTRAGIPTIASHNRYSVLEVFEAEE